MPELRQAILGTAGHIDHGKTALVRALTGVETDRLPEEKARGITIDLGFAEFRGDDGLRLGVVDVPGHEDFVRTMVAGATGMDVVLMAVAADEGVMPQTREHLDIVTLLGVPRLVVALTKIDLVDPEWMELVASDVEDFLSDTPFAGAPVLATSVETGEGLEALRATLLAAAAETRRRTEDDVARLPVDRVFTVQGTGTVVTGTLWSGILRVGDRVRLIPGDTEARIRSLQVHGAEEDTARAGARTAVALAGIDRGAARRGQTLVADPGWASAWMLTVRVEMLPEAPRPLVQGTRVRVLLGTAEVMARCALLEGSMVEPGGEGWVQLRLEEAVVARAGDRFVLRRYSPLETVGGGSVAEAVAPKRRRIDEAERTALTALTGGNAPERLSASLALAGWHGVRTELLAQRARIPPRQLPALLEAAEKDGALVVRGVAFSRDVVHDAAHRVLAALDVGHEADPLRPSVPLDPLRAVLPDWGAPGLADGVLSRMAAEGTVELADGGARRPGFEPRATPDQEEAARALEALYEEAGLAAPFVDELPEALRVRPDLPRLLRHLEEHDIVRTVDAGLFVSARALDEASRAVAAELGGRTGLGPADFREVLPVSRRHLMPLLGWLDGQGVTLRRGPVRDVPAAE